MGFFVSKIYSDETTEKTLDAADMSESSHVSRDKISSSGYLVILQSANRKNSLAVRASDSGVSLDQLKNTEGLLPEQCEFLANELCKRNMIKFDDGLYVAN